MSGSRTYCALLAALSVALVGALSAGTALAQVDLAQVDLAQVDLAQVDLAQVDLAQVDLAQVDLAQVDLAQLDTEVERSDIDASASNPSPTRSTLRLPLGAVVDLGDARFDPVRPAVDGRPRLAARLAFDTLSGPAPGLGVRAGAEPAFSWSLDAWEMNTASLAHVQCSRATRRLESFLVEDCRIIDRPLPDDAGSLVQVRGQWLAAPGLQIGAGAFAGRDAPGGALQPASITSAIDPTIPVSETVEGVNMNISFGLQTRRVGDLLLDLQLERYRRSQPSFATDLGLVPLVDSRLPSGFADEDVQTAGRLGIGWQLDRFRADLTGQYRELPYWLGEQARGQGFSSFDIELSWRAPANASFSVGVTNVLDQRPEDVDGADAALDASIDRIYGRIPYVRYKHDL